MIVYLTESVEEAREKHKDKFDIKVVSSSVLSLLIIPILYEIYEKRRLEK